MRKLIIHDEIIIIDEEDFDIVCQYTWHLINGRHVARRRYETDGPGTPKVMLRRFILGLHNDSSIQSVHHINNNIFDYRKENLEVRYREEVEQQEVEQQIGTLPLYFHTEDDFENSHHYRLWLGWFNSCVIRSSTPDG